VQWALEQPISILTGLPGTGKTTTIRAIVEAAGSAGEAGALGGADRQGRETVSGGCRT